MLNNKDYTELVKQAQLGSRESLDKLAELVRGRLYAYVYRIMLHDDLAHDIVQESMLEMFNAFGKLEKADCFWPWLRGIAFNKIRHYYAKQQHNRTVSISDLGDAGMPKDKHDKSEEGLANLISQELKQTVFDAMGHLKPQHRTVLSMRCYEKMEYSEIAEVIGCSELGARVLFYRAKTAMRKQLSRQGFGRGSLLTALILFGKMTAPTEAAAANVSVTTATTTVGTLAGVVGIASSDAIIMSLKAIAVLATAAGMFTAGTSVPTTWVDKTITAFQKTPAISLPIKEQPSIAEKGIEECWYFFPEGVNGPVMMRLIRVGPDGEQLYCELLQNDLANYYFDKNQNNVCIRNCRMWCSDLKVQRLPTDDAKSREFLSKAEGKTDETQYVSGDGDGLLVIVKNDANNSKNLPQVIHHRNVLDEEYFRYDWSTGVKAVDNRDAMHKRGWTYFTIDGQINGEKISGMGQIPFFYAASKRYNPWLKLQVGEGIKISDGIEGAGVYASDGQLVKAYAAGSFFAGLGRPWMGLHTIDTIRRDAAYEGISFETKYTQDSGKAEISLIFEQGKLFYTIDMEKDVIDRITFSVSDGQGRTREGELKFTYLQDVEQRSGEFVEPSTAAVDGIIQQKGTGMLWLARLAQGSLQ